jgi:hypothetical protein
MKILTFIKYILGKIFKRKKNLSKQLIADLRLLTPKFYDSYIKKYGAENWALIADQLGKIEPKDEETICYEGVIKKLQSEDGNETKSI